MAQFCAFGQTGRAQVPEVHSLDPLSSRFRPVAGNGGGIYDTGRLHLDRLLSKYQTMNAEQQLREEFVQYGRLLHQKGFVAACDGNLTARLGHDRILTTPTGMSKGMMHVDDLVVVDMEGRKLQGKRAASSEIGMHLLIYRLRPDVNGIVHAHPSTATGYAAAGLGLDQALVSEVIQTLGAIPLAPYGTPGTEELGASLEPLIPQHDAILMANHGVVTYGDSLLHAYMKMETVEHFARISLVTHLLGQQNPLSAGAVERLSAGRMRSREQCLAAVMAGTCENS